MVRRGCQSKAAKANAWMAPQAAGNLAGGREAAGEMRHGDRKARWLLRRMRDQGLGGGQAERLPDLTRHIFIWRLGWQTPNSGGVKAHPHAL